MPRAPASVAASTPFPAPPHAPAALLTAGAALATACGGAAAPPTATPALGNLAAPPPAFLVWTQAPDGAAHTTWLTPDGQVRGQADGVVVAVGDALWRVVAEPVRGTLPSCAELLEDPGGNPDRGTSSGESLRLVPLGGGQPVTLHETTARAGDATPAEVGFTEWAETASLAAGLGRYLFVERSTTSYACGAHGVVEAAADVFDLQAGGLTQVVAPADVAHLQADAMRRLTEAGVDAERPAARHGAVLPAWRPDGVGVSHLFWSDTCYACSSPEWSSYTQAVWLDDARLPPALEAEAGTIPGAVLGFLAELPSGGGVSWGTPDAAWAQAFDATASSR